MCVLVGFKGEIGVGWDVEVIVLMVSDCGGL